MIKKISFAFLAVSIVALTLASVANADSLTITLTPSLIVGTSGSLLNVQGTIVNNTGSKIYLNGDNFSLSDSSLMLDDSNFVLNAPFTLAANASSGPFDIFTVLINPSALPGLLSSNFFFVLGGTDSSASGVLGTAQFDVNVRGVSVTEPASIFLIGSGLFAVAIRRRKSARSR